MLHAAAAALCSMCEAQGANAWLGGGEQTWGAYAPCHPRPLPRSLSVSSGHACHLNPPARPIHPLCLPHRAALVCIAEKMSDDLHFDMYDGNLVTLLTVLAKPVALVAGAAPRWMTCFDPNAPGPGPGPGPGLACSAITHAHLCWLGVCRVCLCKVGVGLVVVKGGGGRLCDLQHALCVRGPLGTELGLFGGIFTKRAVAVGWAWHRLLSPADGCGAAGKRLAALQQPLGGLQVIWLRVCGCAQGTDRNSKAWVRVWRASTRG